MSFRILGTGRALPEYVMTNDEMSTIVDTSDEWIRTRTGIAQRRVCTTESIGDWRCRRRKTPCKTQA